MTTAVPRLLRLAALFISVASFYGCAHFATPQDDALKQVTSYEAAQEYDQALAIIAALPPTHPQRARLMQKRPQIEAKAKAFEQNTIKRTGELAAQNRWQDALEVYRTALDKLPQSQALRNDLQAFRKRQTERVEELKLDQLVAKARWIERALPVQEAIVATDPSDWRSQRELERLRKEASGVAQELTVAGLAALEKNNLGVAGRTLPIASRLSSDPVAAHARDQLGTEEAEQARTLRSSQNQAMDQMRQQESRKLLADYQQASRAGDLRRARLIMTRLQDLDGPNPEVVRESNRLKGLLEAAIKRHMDEGNRLYGRGKFDEAMTSWSRVLELDPENELARTSMERAGRVVEKLKQLREKQASEPRSTGK
jgi:tetratricopeptide (TPR) repeat protein